MAITPNMGLDLPTPTVTPGPGYAIQNNSAFTVVDAHTHAPGFGVPIPSAGINIDADLSFYNYNQTTVRTTRFSDQTNAISLPTDLGCIYIAGGDLWYNNGIGQQIQLTAGGALNATSIGGIGGDYGTSTASVFYTSLTQTFTFWQNTNQYATISTGPIILHPLTVSPFGITLQAFPTLSGDYTVTFPNNTPASTKFVTIDASGNLGFSYDVDGTTIQIVGNNLVANSTAILANTYMSTDFKANGKYAIGNAVDEYFFFPYAATIIAVWIFNGTAGSAGTTEFDLKVATTSGGAFSTILSTTGKITSAAASGVWTDSNSVIGPQAGITKPVLSTTSIAAGTALRFDILSAMTSGVDCEIVVQWTKA